MHYDFLYGPEGRSNWEIYCSKWKCSLRFTGRYSCLWHLYINRYKIPKLFFFNCHVVFVLFSCKWRQSICNVFPLYCVSAEMADKQGKKKQWADHRAMCHFCTPRDSTCSGHSPSRQCQTVPQCMSPTLMCSQYQNAGWQCANEQHFMKLQCLHAACFQPRCCNCKA